MDVRGYINERPIVERLRGRTLPCYDRFREPHASPTDSFGALRLTHPSHVGSRRPSGGSTRLHSPPASGTAQSARHRRGVIVHLSTPSSVVGRRSSYLLVVGRRSSYLLVVEEQVIYPVSGRAWSDTAGGRPTRRVRSCRASRRPSGLSPCRGPSPPGSRGC